MCNFHLSCKVLVVVFFFKQHFQKREIGSGQTKRKINNKIIKKKKNKKKIWEKKK